MPRASSGSLVAPLGSGWSDSGASCPQHCALLAARATLKMEGVVLGSYCERPRMEMPSEGVELPLPDSLQRPHQLLGPGSSALMRPVPQLPPSLLEFRQVKEFC